MGWTWEVQVVQARSSGMESWDVVYRGESWWKAVKIARHWKKITDRAVTVIWR